MRTGGNLFRAAAGEGARSLLRLLDPCAHVKEGAVTILLRWACVPASAVQPLPLYHPPSGCTLEGQATLLDRWGCHLSHHCYITQQGCPP